MINSVYSVKFNTNYKPVFKGQENPVKHFENAKTENKENKDSFQSKLKNITPSQKTFAMLGVGIALITAGLLIKRTPRKNDVITPKLKELLDKPKEFNENYICKLIEEMKKSDNLKTGDAIYCIPKQMLSDVTGQKIENINKIWEELKLSENAFVVAPAHNVNGVLQMGNSSSIRFVDPETNTILAFVDKIKNGNMVPFLVL